MTVLGRLLGRLLALLAALLLAGPAAAATLTGVSAVPAVVTVTSDGPVAAGHAFALAGPDRLVIDLPAVVAGAMMAPGAGSVRQMRLAAFSPGVARLVLDLDAPVLLVSAQATDRSLILTLRRATRAEFDAAAKAGRSPLGVTRAPAKLDIVIAPAAGARPLPAMPTSTPSAAPSAVPYAATTTAGVGVPTAATPVQTQPQPPALPEPAPTPPPSSPPPSTPPSTAPAPAPAVVNRPAVRSRSGGKPLVVLDAGHGGKDVGAISVRGGYEKDVTLAIVKATARILEKNGRVRVRLTRDDDRFIPLGGRALIAQRARADLFISVHADAALNQEARGASVYTLSSTASDAVAARLAARENKADIIGGINLGVEAPEVSDILIDLSRRGTTDVSVQFAETLQGSLSQPQSSGIRFRSTFHHFAGFMVLKAPDVPSVLLETGYVSNGEDADFLFSSSGQKKIAEGIARAIERHLLGN
ncbi:hypothetical protein GCM10007973_26080 [Polymorphobacter multimanifer]|uniref:N-acetylmuramoyl-L-alanine amidase n=1 Tax=Polymorphobacter multimanifer TaxID=1070431 RepID=A0A841L059_9SPHN|nr:N-acetylmuramoyl-L-alanine amidase [Polymorphobacter multimanifer]MBB6225924.1 N-acetylmuramoyl-L-alanine amidase [Polymorphobacter multimanifer]GGI88516.1 hypothetical protein GCM10007973_26080 [Polymorphobacter multimanifer]